MILFLVVIVSLVLTIIIYFIMENQREKETKYEILENLNSFHSDNSILLKNIEMKYKDYALILWWGEDGLRLNEDDTLEWISRKKPEPVKQNIFYQPMQGIEPFNYGVFYDKNICQSTQEQIDYLMEQNSCLRLQAAQREQITRIMNCINNNQYSPEMFLSQMLPWYNININ